MKIMLAVLFLSINSGLNCLRAEDLGGGDKYYETRQLALISRSENIEEIQHKIRILFEERFSEVDDVSLHVQRIRGSYIIEIIIRTQSKEETINITETFYSILNQDFKRGYSFIEEPRLFVKKIKEIEYGHGL